MAIIGKNESKPKVLAPTGLQKARCIQVLDLGTQEGEFKGKKYLDHQVKFVFELSECLHVFKEELGLQPHNVSPYAFSTHLGNKKTKEFFEGWLGRPFTPEELKNGFDYSKMLGKAGMVNIVHKPNKNNASKINDHISSISPMIKGSTMVKPIQPLIEFSFGAPNQWEVFEALPKFWQDIIKKSPEWISEAAKANYQAPASEGAAAGISEPEEETFEEEAF